MNYESNDARFLSQSNPKANVFENMVCYTTLGTAQVHISSKNADLLGWVCLKTVLKEQAFVASTMEVWGYHIQVQDRKPRACISSTVNATSSRRQTSRRLTAQEVQRCVQLEHSM